MDLIERVARVIAAEQGDDFDLCFESKADWTASRGIAPGHRFRDINEPMKPDFLCAAKGAIAEVLDAMMEPSEGIVAQVVQQVGDPSPEAWAIGDAVALKLGGPQVDGAWASAELVRDWQAMLAQFRKEALGK